MSLAVVAVKRFQVKVELPQVRWREAFYLQFDCYEGIQTAMKK